MTHPVNAHIERLKADKEFEERLEEAGEDYETRFDPEDKYGFSPHVRIGFIAGAQYAAAEWATEGEELRSELSNISVFYQDTKRQLTAIRKERDALKEKLALAVKALDHIVTPDWRECEECKDAYDGDYIQNHYEEVVSEALDRIKPEVSDE